MTNYLRLEFAQDPMDVGTNDAGYYTMTFNIEIEKYYSTTTSAELVNRLVAQGVGTAGTDIFDTTFATLSGSGPYVLVLPTGGIYPKNIHNETTKPSIQRPTYQIVVQGKNAGAVKTKIWDCYQALEGIRNTDLS